MEFGLKLENRDILQQLEKKGVVNTTILHALHKYAINKPKVTECQHVECDKVFINEHENCEPSEQSFASLLYFICGVSCGLYQQLKYKKVHLDKLVKV